MFYLPILSNPAERVEPNVVEAALSNNIDLLSSLLKNGADVNQVDNGGWSALVASAWLNSTEQVVSQSTAPETICNSNANADNR